MIPQENRSDFPHEPRKTSRPMKSLMWKDFAADFPHSACKT